MSGARETSGNGLGAIALVAPTSPPFGGMANQAALLANCLSKEGFRVLTIPTNVSTGLLEDFVGKAPGLRTAARFVVFCTRLVLHLPRCSLIHIFACSNLYYYLNVIPAVLLGRLFGLRVIVNYRGGEAQVFFAGLARRFLWILRLARAVIVPSDYLRNVFNELDVDVSVVSNLAELERFEHKTMLPKKKKNFVCTRNFEPYYDVLTLVRAFQIVKKMMIDAELLLAGDGSQRQEIEQLIEELDLGDSVHLLGSVPPAAMPDLLANADVFVNSSVVDNYPISILEAFASGLPVVTTCAGGIPFLVRDGWNGLLCAPRDENGLAQAMLRLSRDPELCAQLSRAGKETADKHAWAQIWPLLRSVYGWEQPAGVSAKAGER